MEIPAPKSIIIVGASRDQNKYGNRAVRAFKDAGTTVYAINPHASSIEGVETFKKIVDVPAGKTTMASIYTQPEVTAKILPQLAKYGIKDVYFNPGAQRPKLIKQTEDLGMNPIQACSVTAIGKDPENYAPSAS